jgi:cytochrome P450
MAQPAFRFSGGPRRCIGEGFAQLQLPLVVAMVAQR